MAALEDTQAQLTEELAAEQRAAAEEKKRFAEELAQAGASEEVRCVEWVVP